MILLAGITMLTRPRRWRRLLRSCSWTPYTSSYLPGRAYRANPGVKLSPLENSAHEVAMRLGGVLRGRAAKLAIEPVVWVAGSLDSRVVLAIPRTRELFPAMSPRGRSGHNWLAAQGPLSRRDRRAALVYLGLIAAICAFGAVASANAHQWLLAVVLAAKATLFSWLFARARQKRPTEDALSVSALGISPSPSGAEATRS